MEQMTKLREKPKLLPALWRTILSLSPRREAILYFLAGAVLCPISFGFGATPLGICTLCLCPLASVTAVTAGLLLGYGIFWGLRGAFEMYVLLFCVLCARVLLRKNRRLLHPVCVLASALVGLIFLALDGFSLSAFVHWIINLLCSAFGSLLAGGVKRGSYSSKVCASALLMLGAYLIKLPAGLNIAALALGWIAGMNGALVFLCAGGAAITLVRPYAAAGCCALCAAALCQKLLRERSQAIRLLSACGILFAAGMETEAYGFSACAVAGLLVSVIYSPKFALPTPLRAELPPHPVQNALDAAARAMNAAAQMLRAPETSPSREYAALCENAKDQVCSNCARKENCTVLSENSGEVPHDGEVLLSTGFRTRCLHPDAVQTALNDALDASRAGCRVRRRIDEARCAAQSQYAVMGQYLDRLSRRLYCPEPAINYTPELAVKVAGRGGSRLSGDRGAAFQAPDGTYYVILCDGMGTGEYAARESLDAVRLLRALLSAGLDAENALRSLNSAYVLRDNGCFSTIDLLRVNLTSGDAILYKWGASASYLKRHRGVRILGGGGLPPGIGADEPMEKLHFSLDHGCVVVMLSDGFGEKESLRRLESCTSICPRDVVASLFVGRDAPEDDCTAAALRLSAAKHPTL